jgi:ribonuclease Z
MKKSLSPCLLVLGLILGTSAAFSVENASNPLAAVDNMVWNITKDKIHTRMYAINEDIWPQPSFTKTLPADPSKRVGFTPYLTEGRTVFKDVIKFYYDETNEMFDTDYKIPE